MLCTQHLEPHQEPAEVLYSLVQFNVPNWPLSVQIQTLVVKLGQVKLTNNLLFVLYENKIKTSVSICLAVLPVLNANELSVALSGIGWENEKLLEV